MPWLVSMRMMGQVIGARATVSTRMSVILRSEGLELVLTFCGSASRVSSRTKPAPSAPAARRINDRREFMWGSFGLKRRYIPDRGAVQLREKTDFTAETPRKNKGESKTALVSAERACLPGGFEDAEEEHNTP